jgi:hypothetical protein
METVLYNIERSLPIDLKQNFKKQLTISCSSFIDLSIKLKNMVESYGELKEILFSNSDDAIYFSGDILAKTLHDYWIKGGCIKEIFIENAQATAFYAGFECVW